MEPSWVTFPSAGPSSLEFVEEMGPVRELDYDPMSGMYTLVGHSRELASESGLPAVVHLRVAYKEDLEWMLVCQ